MEIGHLFYCVLRFSLAPPSSYNIAVVKFSFLFLLICGCLLLHLNVLPGEKKCYIFLYFKIARKKRTHLTTNSTIFPSCSFSAFVAFSVVLLFNHYNKN